MAIQFRRGNEADLVAEQLLPAEPAFSLDTKRFLIGDGEGVAAVPTEAQVVSITTSLMSQRLPVGTILMWPGTTAPAGTLILQGQLVNRADWPDLWQFAQNSGNIVNDALWSSRKGSFSTGNGSTTFRLPDLRGMVPVGYDSTQAEFNVLGKSGGEKAVTLQESQVPLKTWQLNASSGSPLSAVFRTINNQNINVVETANYSYAQGGTLSSLAAVVSWSYGGGGSHNNLQPYATVNFIIIAKAETTHGDIESALANLISQTQTARDNANQAANDARQMMDDIENMVTEGVAEAKGYTDAVAAGKVDKVAGKGLSTNDYTNTDKSKVDNLPANTNAELDSKADLYYVSTNLAALNTSKADKSALSETNLRVAEISKDLSDYKAVLSQLNPNQEAKQTISDYGIVPLPVNAANGHMDVAVGGNTEINENGMQHTVSAMRIVSESEDKSQRTELYIPDYGELRSVPNGTADEISGGQLIQRVKTIAITANAIIGLGTAGVNVDWVVISKPTDYIGYGTSGYATGTFTFGNYTEKRISTLDLPENINCISSHGPETFYLVIPKGTYANLNAAKTALAGTKLTYQLAEPIITPINVSGTLLSYPKGTVYFEPVLPVAGIYTANGISVTNTDFPIESIERIYKIDFATGVETPIDVSKVVVAGNGLGFTHPDLADGDIVFFTYYYNTGTRPKISATYFDSRYVLKDTVTGKFYKKVETVQNGQLVTQLVEVS